MGIPYTPSEDPPEMTWLLELKYVYILILLYYVFNPAFCRKYVFVPILFKLASSVDDQLAPSKCIFLYLYLCFKSVDAG